MARLGVTERARRLMERLRTSPFLLVKTDLQAFLNLLHSDEVTRIVLTSLLERERENLGAHAGSFTSGTPGKHQVGLDFLKTFEQRAAFGYQVVSGLLSSGLATQEFENRLLTIGLHYRITDDVSSAAAIAGFVTTFVEPIVDYLEGAQEVDDVILATMIKYKQRAEWFETETLGKIALGNESETGGPPTGQAEERLKHDFYRYLFDRGLEFVVDPRSPKGSGAADVLTARFSDGRRLIVEAKVYDGVDRDQSHVKGGVPQTASYATEWAEPRAYLLVYNVAPNTIVEFVGAAEGEYFWAAKSLGREIRIFSVNLNIRLPASQASQLSRVRIDLAE